MDSRFLASPPTDRETVATLQFVGRLLRAECAWQLDGTFYFPLSEEWALAITPDSAGRFRVGACYGATEVASMWSRSRDWSRLANLIVSLRTEVREVV